MDLFVFKISLRSIKISKDVIREAKKIGMVVAYDPPGIRDLCFYECLSCYLGLHKYIIVGKLEEFMLDHQYPGIKHEVRLILQ